VTQSTIEVVRNLKVDLITFLLFFYLLISLRHINHMLRWFATEWAHAAEVLLRKCNTAVRPRLCLFRFVVKVFSSLPTLPRSSMSSWMVSMSFLIVSPALFRSTVDFSLKRDVKYFYEVLCQAV
jgi:hypothetical protein